MFKKILRFSYTLFYNVHKSKSSHIRPTTSAVVFTHQTQRRFYYCHRTNRILVDKKLQHKSSFNTSLCIIRRSTTSSKTNSMKMLNYLPFFASGEVVSGFGRGSKELGIPTANYPLDVVKSLPDCFQPGVYYGWANVDNGPVHKMVMSIGWNPFFDNKEKSMETHIMHQFNGDFYGCLLKVCIVGYLRSEKNFNSLEDLITAIKNDITQAEDALETNDTYKTLQNHHFFSENGIVSNDVKKNNTNSENV